MTDLKHIVATLAILGTGTLGITACDKGGDSTNNPDADAAPADGEGSCSGDKAEGSCSGDKAEGSCSGDKAEGSCSGEGEGEASCSGEAEGEGEASCSGEADAESE